MDIRNSLEHLRQALKYYIMLMFCRIGGELIVVLSAGGAQLDKTLPESVLMDELFAILESRSFSVVIATYMAMVLWLWWMHNARKQPVVLAARLNKKIGSAGMLWAVVMGFAAGIWFLLVKGAITPVMTPFEAYISEGVKTVANADGLFIKIMAMIIIAPVFEEIIFRGLIFSRFRVIMPAVPAVMCQALMFGSLYSSESEMVTRFLFALVLGFAVLKTSSLKCSLALHMAHNWAVLMAGGYSEVLFASQTSVRAALIASAVVFVLGGFMFFRHGAQNDQ